MKTKKQLEANKKLSEIFDEMAVFYAYLGPSQRFRSRAYEKASKLLSAMHEPILPIAKNKTKLNQLHGIGESIASKIQEYATSGKIAAYQQLKHQVPYDLMQLLHTEGIGPATIHSIENEFHVHNRKELIAALNSCPKFPKGFGKRKMMLLRDALHIDGINENKRMPLAEIIPISNRILTFIKHIPYIDQVAVAGSIRRRRDTIGDIDIVASCLSVYAPDISNRLVLYTYVKRVLSKGKTKISMRLTENNIQCDVRLVSPDSYGAALLYFTGSKEHNIQLRTIAKQRGLKINEYGVFDATGRKIAGKTETEVYASLGLAFIPPEKRIGANEIHEAEMIEGKRDMVW